MSYKDQKSSPIVEVMGPESHTIFQHTKYGRFEVEETQDFKKARQILSDLREANPGIKYTMQTEERPDLAPNTPLKKMQPSGWKL